MLIPIGHDQGGSRRWPVVTMTLAALCILSFMAQTMAPGADPEEVQYALWEAVEHAIQYPGTELPPAIASLFSESELTDRSLSADTYPSTEEDQAELNHLVERFVELRDQMTIRRFGSVPAEPYGLGLVTYMFLHTGLMHLLGNLLFLCIAGPPLEDAWGRSLFIAFYAAAGVLSAILFGLHYPALDVPLVGASGAIAGLMGAFLIRFWRARIRFFYFYWLLLRVFTGTFFAPAWVMLPLWLLSEVWSSYLMDTFLPGGGGGVAHWAHIWGFLVGVLTALGVGLLRVEQRFLSARIDEASGALVNSNLERAFELRELGRHEEAKSLLLRELHGNASNVDVASALWDLGVDLECEAEVAESVARSMIHELRSGDSDYAASFLGGMWDRYPELPFDARLAIVIGDASRVAGIHERARELLSGVGRRFPLATGESGGGSGREEAVRGLPVAHLLKWLRALCELDPALGEENVELALARIDLDTESRRQLESLKANGVVTASSGQPLPLAPGEAELPQQVGAQGHDVPAPDLPPLPLATEAPPPAASITPARPKPIPLSGSEPRPSATPVASPNVASGPKTDVTVVEPLSFQGQELSIALADGRRAKVRLAQIPAVAHGVIQQPGELPGGVIDLFLGDLQADPVRLLRFDSSKFDVARVVSGTSEEESFRKLFLWIAQQSGAQVLVGAGSIARFDSATSYAAACAQAILALRSEPADHQTPSLGMVRQGS